MNLNERIRQTKTAAAEQDAARLERMRRVAEQHQPTAPPAWAEKGVPTISLDAIYAGSADPSAEIPRDSVTRREIKPNERASNAPLTDEQREGLRVASVLAARDDLRRVAEQAAAPAQPKRQGGDL